MPPRIALIHAVATAIPPIQQAFREDWPEAQLSNLLDDDLMPAYTREGGLTPHITERICALALYAARSGADGILFTCSVFPQAEDLAKQLVRVPLLKPDEAMIAAALDAGSRIGVVATNPPAAPAAAAQLVAGAKARGVEVRWSNPWPKAPSPSAMRAIAPPTIAWSLRRRSASPIRWTSSAWPRSPWRWRGAPCRPR